MMSHTQEDGVQACETMCHIGRKKCDVAKKHYNSVFFRNGWKPVMLFKEQGESNE